jgi:membrane protein
LIAWDDDDIAQQGAALSFYTVFSLSPLLILVMVLSGIVFGEDAASGHLVKQIRGVIGTEAAQYVQSQIVTVNKSKVTAPAVIFSGIMLWFGASGVFLQLRDSLNMIFRVRLKPRGTIRGFLAGRLTAFMMILGIALLLFLSLVASAAFTYAGLYLNDHSTLLSGTGVYLDWFFSVAGVTLMFALMLRFLPAAVLAWKDIWIGASVTSVFFSIGKILIGLYAGKAGVDPAFGAARSMIIFMIWAYYSSQILLLGAEFTRLYSERFGTKNVPKKTAVRSGTG